MGGGGGGDDGSARQAEQERRRAKARASVNRIFGVTSGTKAPVGGDPIANTNRDAREKAYTDIRKNVFDYHKTMLDEDRTPAAQQLKFALLRTGNAGGKLDIDQNAKLDRAYDRGVLDVTNLSDASATDMRGADESARLDLLSRIDAGMDEGSAVQGALSNLKTSGDRALETAKGQTLSNVFDNAGLLYSASQIGQGKADARRLYENVFAKVPGNAAGSNYYGTVGR